MSDLSIIPLPTDLEESWDEYVNDHNNGTFFHLSKWRNVLESSLGHKTYYVCAMTGEHIVGVLPLCHVKSLLFGNTLCSTPFSVYGGPLADSSAIRDALLDYAKKTATNLNVDVLEIRNQGEAIEGWETKDLYVTFRKEISDDDEENMKAIPRKQRAMVRKGIKAGLHSVIDNNVDDFFQAYSESVRNLGTPVFPKRYFKALLEEFSDSIDILTVRSKENELVASVMSFYYKDEVLPYYGGGTYLARNLKGNDFMYWDLMCHAVRKGVRIFDYGRSKQGTGSYSFKKNWGFEPKKMGYSYYLVKATELPDINPLNPKYQMFIKTWKKLPLSVANFIGPFLARNLG